MLFAYSPNPCYNWAKEIGGERMRIFNYNLLADRLWDSETLSLVAQIHEYKGRQELYLKQQPAVLDKLIEVAKIQSTEASNKIEGIVTTSTRVKELYQEKTMPRNRDEEEIMGYRDVLNTIHENYEYIPLRSSYILQLHRDLYQYSAKSIGGRYKNTRNYVAETHPDGTQTVRFVPVEPFETPDAVDAICENFNQALDACILDPLVLIPVFILDFLCIHPFNDGNGRMARLLTTLLLYRCGYVVGRYVSLESKIEKTKEEYYAVLEQSGIGWHEASNDPTPFVKYLLKIILSAYRDFESRVDIFGERLPAVELVRNAVESRIGKFTKNDIMEMVPSIGKTSVESALKKLMQDKAIGRDGKGMATFYTRISE